MYKEVVLSNTPSIYYIDNLSYTTIIPGSTIVVPRDAAPFEWLYLASTVAPILSGVALAAASLSAISD